MLDYAFTALGLRSVMLATDAFNLAAQAAYRPPGGQDGLVQRRRSTGTQPRCAILGLGRAARVPPSGSGRRRR